MGNIRVKK